MTTKFFLTTILLTISCLVFSNPSDTIQIYAGKGINKIVLLQSSQGKIQKFKRSTYSREKGTYLSDGPDGQKRRRFVRYHIDSLGLTFEFSASSSLFSKMKLHKITITNPISKTILTANGVIINKSTKQNVINKFGPIPDEWQNGSYVEYDEKGIAFHFNDNSVVDLVEIFIAGKKKLWTKKVKAPKPPKAVKPPKD